MSEYETILEHTKLILKRLDVIEGKDFLKRYGLRMSSGHVLLELGYSDKSRNILKALDQKYKIIDHSVKNSDRVYITSKILELKNKLGK